jgi:hypothetical protein
MHGLNLWFWHSHFFGIDDTGFFQWRHCLFVNGTSPTRSPLSHNQSILLQSISRSLFFSFFDKHKDTAPIKAYWNHKANRIPTADTELLNIVVTLFTTHQLTSVASCCIKHKCSFVIPRKLCEVAGFIYCGFTSNNCWWCLFQQWRVLKPDTACTLRPRIETFSHKFRIFLCCPVLICSIRDLVIVWYSHARRPTWCLKHCLELNSEFKCARWSNPWNWNTWKSEER